MAPGKARVPLASVCQTRGNPERVPLVGPPLRNRLLAGFGAKHTAVPTVWPTQGARDANNATPAAIGSVGVTQ